ncbi:MAG: dTDP-4-dehydrorhamnose reductase [Williamsia sp.]|nr:dTDP-4-dehydrorhamnose reductase [Williamsia sp.]
MRPTILVTGANGQVGRELRVCAETNAQYDFVFLSKDDLSIDRPEQVEEVFQKWAPKYCINCAAYTAVDKAETEQALAFQINGEATGVLAAASRQAGARFIHISTDYVFNGNGTAPYQEDHAVDPVNIYGASKLQGEQLAKQQNPDSVIIRTSWVYSRFGNNFVKTMMRLMKERESINVVDDQKGSPTYAADLAAAMLKIIASEKWTPGIYNYSNEGVITWHQFAQAIAELTRSSCKVNPIPSANFPTPAKRPGYSVLSKDKIREVYQITPPAWRTSLEACIRLLQQS